MEKRIVQLMRDQLSLLIVRVENARHQFVIGAIQAVQTVLDDDAILAHQWDQWVFGLVIIPVRWIAVAAIYFTVLVSVISAIDYFVGFWKQIDHASKDRRKAFVLGRRKSPIIS